MTEQDTHDHHRAQLDGLGWLIQLFASIAIMIIALYVLGVIP